MSRDASLYRIVPNEVVRAESVNDVSRLLRFCSENQRHVTFRAGGTSLSGQAIGSDIVVNIARGWDSIQILDHGNAIALGPGVTGGRANHVLRTYGKKLGPDPASMSAAMIGGIIANNSSGMCCGTKDNAYQTLVALDVLLADGTRIDTANPDADVILKHQNPVLYQSVLDLRDRVRSNHSLCEKIQHKYSIKNTMGYSLNAFLDEDLPSRIVARLMVGSEGTLGFIINATFRTIPDAKDKWTLMETFSTIENACEAALEWTVSGAAAVELMDDASLASFSSLNGTPDAYRFAKQGAAAVLVEFHNHEPGTDRAWLTNPKEQAVLWKLRKGLMPTIGAQRKSGETMINEDVAVSPTQLANLVVDVKNVFRKHEYSKAIIFGHAKDGNIHFVVNQRFDSAQQIARYDRFMHDIAALVLGKYNGSLKAEHGTGRNMAPFLEMEWGSDAILIMQAIKSILDPNGILNPGVLLNQNPTVHLENIKEVPTVDFEVDRCIECGFCEHVCPTRDVTLTPRQRIVLRRELQLTSDSDIYDELSRAETILSIDSCVVDGYCSVACPVGIDTGSLVRRLRAERTSRMAGAVGTWVANNFKNASTLAGIGVRAILKSHSKPSYKQHSTITRRSDITVGYLPSCPSRWTDKSQYAMHAIAEHAGISLLIPPMYESLCCGQPFESKGLIQGHSVTTQNLRSKLSGIKDSCDSVLVSDTSTCTAAMTKSLVGDGWSVLSDVAWIKEFVLPRVTVKPVTLKVAVHPGCGYAKLAEQDLILEIVQHITENAYVPAESYCCGQGGVQGFLHPDTPNAAISPMRWSLAEQPPDVLVTGNVFCAHAIEKYAGIKTMTFIDFIAWVLNYETTAPSR